ncbi:hypothetical protein [Paenibacillus agri]|uniref:hypothetical protein n=1 Tax=Paenibacillus agri TaxID=2744309 RepID=UPI001FE6B92A|nr:hypothetical protein [Paenibacillus agri]
MHEINTPSILMFLFMNGECEGHAPGNGASASNDERKETADVRCGFWIDSFRIILPEKIAQHSAFPMQ